MIDTVVIIGIEPDLSESIEIYPNPAENTLTLHFSSSVNITQLQLFNTIGQLVWHEYAVKMNRGTIKTIHIGSLTKGVYILSIETERGILKRKLVIQ